MGICSSKTGVAPPKPAAAAAPAAAPLKTQKRVRTGVASVEDLAGEGDGCDRCFGKGCDEEGCCPSFWQDEGVPPVWPLSWVFSRTNPYTNDNDYVEVLGNCGFKSADRERKALMGTALAFTVVSIVLTVFGSLALAPSDSLTVAAAWAIGGLVEKDSDVGTLAFIGLRRVLLRTCTENVHQPWAKWAGCATQSYTWAEIPAVCSAAAAREELAVELAEAAEFSGLTDVDFSLYKGQELDFSLGYPCTPLLMCAEQAIANQFGAFVTCVTLIFALIGCLTRIRKRADTNFQKIIGTFPDLIGIMTLGVALLTFGAKCTNSMITDANEVGTGYKSGAGYLAYSFCWVAAVVRFSMHAMMPVPHAGLHVQDIVDVAVDIAEDGTYDGYRKTNKVQQPQAPVTKALPTQTQATTASATKATATMH